MDIYDFVKQMTRGMNGVNMGGDLMFSYDDEHRIKVEELIKENSRYLYAIQMKCGINPFSEDYYGEHNGDITIVNVDHFAIAAKAQQQAEELRQEVYDAIDWVYENRKAALKELAAYEYETDPFDMDWPEDEDDYVEEEDPEDEDDGIGGVSW